MSIYVTVRDNQPPYGWKFKAYIFQDDFLLSLCALEKGLFSGHMLGAYLNQFHFYFPASVFLSLMKD